MPDYNEGVHILRRGELLRTTLCMQAGGGNFGLQKPLATNPVAGPPLLTNLCRLSKETDWASSHPELLAVSIDLEIQGEITGTERLVVFAELRWHTGAGSNRAEIDVPAQGTVAVVTAGDGLSVDLFRNRGPDAMQNDVIARLNVGFTSGAPLASSPTRTVQTVLPMAVPAPIPRFARALETYPDVIGDISPPPAARRTRFFFTAGGAPMAEGLALGGGGSAPLAVPNGALFYDVIGRAGTTVQSVFKLAL